MRVLVAFDKFKDCLSAGEACSIAAATISQAHPDWEVRIAPLTDGGDGFATVLTAAVGGDLLTSRVEGPRGEPVDAVWGVVKAAAVPGPARAILGLSERGKVAVLEMAEASGLRLLSGPLRDPWSTSTRGVGELLVAAAAREPDAILLGVGGSGTHDLGLGALERLGLRFSVEASDEIPVEPRLPRNWRRVTGFRMQHPRQKFPPIWIASDVENPLVGPAGAAAVFAEQKGLRSEDVAALEVQTARMAGLLCHFFHAPRDLPHQPGMGAAGGLGFGLTVGCGARLTPGFPLVKQWLDLDEKLNQSDLIITGEGRFDGPSLGGKGPGAIVREAQARGLPCFVFAGSVDLRDEIVQANPGIRFRSIAPPDWPLGRKLAEVRTLLDRAVAAALEKYVIS